MEGGIPSGGLKKSAGAAAMMKGYREENNRIDIAGYRRILKGIGGIEEEYEELIPPKFRFLAPLVRRRKGFHLDAIAAVAEPAGAPSPRTIARHAFSTRSHRLSRSIA